MNVNRDGNFLCSNDKLQSQNFISLNQSKNIPTKLASKLRLKKMSTIVQGKIFEDSINDYSDFHIKNDQSIDNKLIVDDMKRAQTSHGILGRNASFS